jgi:hypothetical protein
MSKLLYLTCNWDTNENITNHWNSKLDKVRYPSISLTRDRGAADYYVVFNKPNNDEGDFDFKTKKSILVRMEPNMAKNVHLWGDQWADPDYSMFKAVISPPQSLNFVEWHLAKTFTELQSTEFTDKTKGNIVSVIVSDKYHDDGQIKRIDFIRYLQTHHAEDIQLDVYGKGNLERWGIRNHIGELPVYNKDNGILPYKYHFNCENSFTPNYITEKLYDGVLSNTLTFYGGATNVNSLFTHGGFVYLNLDDFKESAKVMVDAVKSDRYEKEMENIKALKHTILDKHTFSKRMYDIIQ